MLKPDIRPGVHATKGIKLELDEGETLKGYLVHIDPPE